MAGSKKNGWPSCGRNESSERKINRYFVDGRILKVKCVVNSDKGDLWKAVKVARDHKR